MAVALVLTFVLAPLEASAATATAPAPTPKWVAAYWADWAYYQDPSFTGDNVDCTRMTHVDYAFVWNDKAGQVYVTARAMFDGLGAVRAAVRGGSGLSQG